MKGLFCLKPINVIRYYHDVPDWGIIGGIKLVVDKIIRDGVAVVDNDGDNVVDIVVDNVGDCVVDNVVDNVGDCVVVNVDNTVVDCIFEV